MLDGSYIVVFLKWVLYFFDTEHTVTCFLGHQRMPVSVTQLLSVFIFQPQPKKTVFGGNDIIKLSKNASEIALCRKPSVLGCGTLHAMPLDIYSSIVFGMPPRHVV